MFFSKYNSTKIYWIKKHKSKNYAFAENIEKNNKISKAFIDKYINQISDVNSFHELGVGSGRNINIFMQYFPNIKYSGNDITENLGNYVKTAYPNVYEKAKLFVKDTQLYLNDSATVDITFTHGHLMHIPDDAIEDVCMNISLKTKKYILIREAFINNPGAGLFRNLRYKKYRFDRDYTNKFFGFKLIDKEIKDHPNKKWVRQGEYFFKKI